MISKQDYQDFEVILVDNKSDDNNENNSLPNKTIDAVDSGKNNKIIQNLVDNDVKDNENKIIWENFPVARLKKGSDYLSPEIEILSDDALDDLSKSKLEMFLVIGPLKN